MAFNVLSIGSIYSEPIRKLLDVVLPDATFTGRTDIWQFVSEHVPQRPLTGYGFADVLGHPEVVYGMGGDEVWANTAGHAHNGYLDLALTIGIPGAALVTLWLVVLPLIDFYRSPHEPAARAAGNVVPAGLSVCGLRILLREHAAAGRRAPRCFCSRRPSGCGYFR